MNFLLINCPIRETSSPNLVPLGVGYISSILKQAGHKVDVLDINCARLTKEQVEKYLKISAGRYDYYGISGIVTTYSYQKWLIEIIRKYSKKPIVCGGGCASVVGNLLLKAGATEVIKGEGENQLLCYLGEPARYKTIDEIPSPDWSIFNMEVYLRNPIWGKDSGNTSNIDIHPDMYSIKRSVNVITSRGCPFNCNFCYDLFGRCYRQRNVDNVIDELKVLKRDYAIDFVGFVDDNMMVNKRWILEFCDKMSSLKLLWGCHARVNEVNPEVLESAYESGCRWIGYGIESGSQTILNLMNKKVTVNVAKQALFDTKRAGIYPNTSFIFGYPGECKKTVDETIQFCKETGIKPSFFYATPYPGSKLYTDNELRILDKSSNFENFISKLGEANDFVINLTDMPDNKFFKLREYLEESVNYEDVKA